ncbi:hypothetical protein GCM10017600_45640 [Streptosporangium carneum]|uniref:Uncharacterized protein n=1 Tax=Streptosporangium carneum TaxID=47481 RepID=A0A9W6MET4_9ACTN|nr:hypothetical protein GCM10017600_45640 [Streptosporangium carneum]
MEAAVDLPRLPPARFIAAEQTWRHFRRYSRGYRRFGSLQRRLGKILFIGFWT